MTDFLRQIEVLGRAPSRAEVALAEEHHLLVRMAVLELQNEVHGWALRHAREVPIDALRDLYEAIGLRKKVRL